MQTGYALRGEATGHPKGVAVKVPDEALIASIAHGDRSAMQVLYARHSVRVFRFILRLTGNASLAEDMLSEVFLYVWRRAEAFEAKSKVSTWLLAIARYKAISALRRGCDEPLTMRGRPPLKIPRTIRRPRSTPSSAARSSAGA